MNKPGLLSYILAFGSLLRAKSCLLSNGKVELVLLLQLLLLIWREVQGKRRRSLLKVKVWHEDIFV